MHRPGVFGEKLHHKDIEAQSFEAKSAIRNDCGMIVPWRLTWWGVFAEKIAGRLT
jgi:hypothetical protein